MARTPEPLADAEDNPSDGPQPPADLDVSFHVNEFGETVSFRSGQSSDTGGPGVIADTLEFEDAPKSVGRYRIDSVLGAGGFGAVYRGYDDQLDRPVAIKLPLLRRKDQEEVHEDFLREARQLAKLNHPGIVSVFDVGVVDGRCYIVTEFLEGSNLNRWLADHKPDWKHGVAIVAELADALAHAHALSTVHRDVKPANIIMVTRPEGLRPVLVDFGLAVSDLVSKKTERGAISGTPNYMSPEQAIGEGHRIDGRTDVYALGVVLYRILCGQLPFRANRLSDLMKQVVSDEPQPLRQLVPTLPASLERICLKALSKQVKDRYTTAADFAEELRSLVEGLERTVVLPASTVPGSATETPSFDEPPSEEMRSSIRRPRDAEHRHVTMLVCNSEFFESEDFFEIDPEEQHDLQLAYRRVCTDTISESEGTIVEFTSEGMLACFGFPVAFEDSVQRAMRSGLALQVALAELSVQEKHELRPQIAVHTGAVIAELTADSGTSESLSVVGAGRNVTARLCDLAEPDSFVVSSVSHDLVKGFFNCETLGTHKIRGASEPLEVFRVTGESEVRHRLDLLSPTDLTPLIGRNTELSILRERWEQAAESMGQVVLLIGEAGLGKSRLIREIRDHVTQTEPEAHLIELRCSSQHQNSGLHPARDFFERLLGFHHDTTPNEKLDALVEHLNEYGLTSGENVPLFAALLSIPLDERYTALQLPPQKQKELTQQALLEWLRQYSSRQPVLFIVEDLHWVDPSTLEVLGLLIEQGFQQSILSILTFRPEFTTPWASAGHQTQIALNRLTKRQVGQLMREHTGIHNLSDELIEQIVDRTDGVPLFVEEFTRVVQDADELQDVDGSVQLSGSFQQVSIPASLHDLLASRLDRMDCLHDVVQLGATLGREFTYELLAAASGIDEQTLHAELSKLVQAGVLFEKGQPPQCSYIFKHALIQDAAYDSLLKKKRQQFHRQIATTLEQQFPETVLSEPELIAHHFTEAVEIPKAVEYWLKAGTHAQETSANLEAINHLERGIELLESLPESPERDGMELQIKLPLSAVLMGVRGYAEPEIEPIHERAIEICRKLQAPFLFGVMEANWAWLFIGCKFDQAFARTDELLALAAETGDVGQATEAHWTVNCISFYNGKFPEAVEHGELAWKTWDPDVSAEYAKLTQQNSGPLVLAHIGMAQWKMGYVEQGPARVHEALNLAIKIDNVFTRTIMEWKLSQIGDYSRNGQMALEHAQRCLRIAEEQSFQWWIAIGNCCQGVGLHMLGRHKEAIESLREGLAANHASGAGILFAKYTAWLAVALWHDGQREAAWEQLHEAFPYLEKGERYTEAELHRFRGDFHFDEGDFDQAENWYRSSIDVARRQSAKSYELRSTMHLCRIWQQQDRIDEARESLSTVYNCFTEGFDTLDLVEARRMLDDFSS